MDEVTRKVATIDEYMATFPQHVQEILQQIRQTIHAAAPTAAETIKYQMPTFTLQGMHRGNLIHFAAFKSHIGFYGYSEATIAAFKQELVTYVTDKGTIKFPLDHPMPFDLIRRMIEYCVKETVVKAK